MHRLTEESLTDEMKLIITQWIAPLGYGGIGLTIMSAVIVSGRQHVVYAFVPGLLLLSIAAFAWNSARKLRKVRLKKNEFITYDRDTFESIPVTQLRSFSLRRTNAGYVLLLKSTAGNELTTIVPSGRITEIGCFLASYARTEK